MKSWVRDSTTGSCWRDYEPSDTWELYSFRVNVSHVNGNVPNAEVCINAGLGGKHESMYERDASPLIQLASHVIAKHLVSNDLLREIPVVTWVTSPRLATKELCMVAVEFALPGKKWRVAVASDDYNRSVMYAIWHGYVYLVARS